MLTSFQCRLVLGFAGICCSKAPRDSHLSALDPPFERQSDEWGGNLLMQHLGKLDSPSKSRYQASAERSPVKVGATEPRTSTTCGGRLLHWPIRTIERSTSTIKIRPRILVSKFMVFDNAPSRTNIPVKTTNQNRKAHVCRKMPCDSQPHSGSVPSCHGQGHAQPHKSGKNAALAAASQPPPTLRRSRSFSSRYMSRSFSIALI